MSRKKSSSKKNISLDAKFKSPIIPKLINSLMYDGKKTIAEKIVYDAIEKIKSKSKDEPKPLEIPKRAQNNRVYYYCFKIIKSGAFQMVVLLVITANTITLAMD